MANQVKVVFATGRTLRYIAYAPNGTARGAGTAILLTETGSTGYYTNSIDDTTIVAGDSVRVTDDVYGFVGGAEYKPEISATEIEAKIDIIDTNVDTLIVGQNKVNNSYPDLTEDERARILYI